MSAQDVVVLSHHAPGLCRDCGGALSWRQTAYCSADCRERWYRNHRWAQAREAAMVASGSRCARCGGRATEVDHIRPRNGFPLSAMSCLHHQDNLRTLCHSCHVDRRLWDAP